MLADAYPHSVNQVLGSELSWQLEQNANTHAMLLNGLEYAERSVTKIVLSRLKSWLDANSLSGESEAALAARTRQVAGVILKHGDEGALVHLLDKSRKCLELNLQTDLRLMWLKTLISLDPKSGVLALEQELAQIEPSANSTALALFARFFSDQREAINLSDARFTPALLLQLLRLAYRQSSVVPNTRREAQSARGNILNRLLDSKGEEAWAVKLELAADPLCADFKDRILIHAELSFAQEIDSEVYDEAQACTLDRSGQTAALSNESMFGIMKDRLNDIDDLLTRDDSPREAWQGIKNERVMRREIARALRDASNGIYLVDQEAATADEKETDIRLRSVTSAYEAVIELKLGDERTAKDLRDTIKDQLAKKYMAPETRRAGALLVTLAKDREWEHPDEKRMIDAQELLVLLRAEADRVQAALCNSTAIYVHLLDLRPRLPTESSNKALKPGTKGGKKTK